VAIRADDVALGDLLEDALPAPAGQVAADVEDFVPQVVELEDDGISFAAVEAWVRKEELEQVPRALVGEPPFLNRRTIDVLSAVRQVVPSLVSGSARPTVAVALVSRLPSPREVLGWLEVGAAVALLVRRSVAHDERMFARAPDGFRLH
jgi:hypothetical protein